VATQVDVSSQVKAESERRARLSVPAFGGGFLYLLSTIVISQTFSGAPTVGLIQGLRPGLEGVANPRESPRTAEVEYISHHAFPLIAGGVLEAIAIVILMLVLLLLADAARFRRPEMPGVWRVMVLAGGVAVAVVTVAHELVTAIETHKFAVSSNHSDHAVEQALTSAAPNYVVLLLGLFATLVLAVGMFAVLINALRVGLVPRWMAMVGMLAAFLTFVPIGGATFQVVPAFWIVMMGLLYAGKWPRRQDGSGGDPPAWAAGAAVPWPPRQPGRLGGRTAGTPAVATADAGPAPAPPPGTRSSRKRRRGARS